MKKEEECEIKKKREINRVDLKFRHERYDLCERYMYMYERYEVRVV